MSDSTPIKLPSSAPFPVIISSIQCKKGDSISKHETIFKYKYWVYQDDPNSKEDPPKKMRAECIGTFESPIEGTVESINIHPQEEVMHSDVEILHIKEACAHTVQYGGLCALCGKSLEEERDYSGYDYEDRATIAMSHDNSGLKISFDEAAKIEHSTTDRLNEEEKLILVVDLDQTVIHATVDPTVGEWQSDPSNPNYPAVKDVKTFCLEEDPIVPPGWTGPKLAPTKCWYYVKVRPGLSEFLQKMDTKYEMHIYTMATRNYALAIAKIIDPDGKYFGDRILSRDESGSLTHKNLKRLFPVDQSMVVIIDDRGDVWQWENNLIKVVPYDFFVGIGDINSSFLPKKNGQLTGPIKKRKSVAKLEAAAELSKEEGEAKLQVGETNGVQEHAQENSPNTVDRIIELGGGEGNTNLLLEQSITRNQSIEQQQHERPLAKLQHDLEQLQEKSDGEKSSHSEDAEDEEEENLLYDDDNELMSLVKVLDNVHEEYYNLYDDTKAKLHSIKPDLTKIIPRMKSQCLQGVTILFSGIIPLGVNIDSADIVIWCKQFGVKVVNEVYPEVTHVVCRDVSPETGPTFKTRVAHKLYPDSIKIVNPDWLFSCLSTWTKVDEEDYLVSTSDPKLWFVKPNEIEKYKKKLEEAKQTTNFEIDPLSGNGEGWNGGRSNSINSIEDYGLDEADQEVDDFLAGLSDDDNEDDNHGNEEDEGDDDEEVTATSDGNDSFIRDIYKKKRTVTQVEEEDDDSDQEDSMDVDDNKKRKINSSGGDDGEQDVNDNEIDDLEQALLDGFDDLEE
ncbi:Fcp1 protein [Candida orthopsilosis Co 90-125]|uniref:RNA polymerase II subunit A C-terminal domain phosphatase n=1 Tax=Candida orthopsilosis (strain 90-125) TaxID=1136231 RepID=H8X2E9_CANO9|nr:Fcp1 protein [Candida orthopsilosis Co 90-125]CCG25496.1 Fcp1 protein [Candida orthopsilosis Co 90-125]